MLLRKREIIRRGMLYHKAFWGPIIAAAMGIGAGFLSKDDDDDGPLYEQLPDYPESEGAREMWWEKLQKWGTQPGYGAIAPDWGDMWERARGKVSRYYWGGPTSPGAIGKVKASAARRGVSESPALQTMTGRMAKEEGLALKDIASEQSLQEALFGERGRQNWMTQLMGLSSMKPSFISIPRDDGGGSGLADIIGKAGGAIGGAVSQWENRNWYEGLLEKYGRTSVASTDWFTGTQ